MEIKVPPLGESVTEATVARWLKKSGDAVDRDEPLVELETDKVTLEVNAPIQGVLGEILFPQGATVKMGENLCTLQSLTDHPSSTLKDSSLPPENTVTTPSVQISTASSKEGDFEATASPAARKLLAENSIDGLNLTGTGKEGRITKSDVLEALEKKPSVTLPETSQSSSSSEENIVKMSRLRQRIAERLKQAQNTAAILTTFNEVDMGAIMTLRDQWKDPFEKKHGIKLGFMSFFVKACLTALKEIPAINAEIRGDSIVYKNYYDIGIAVGTPLGLVVPVLRKADQYSFAEIEKELNAVGVKAREGKLTIEEMAGGTFTISNGGVYGSLLSTPILNPPQSGILGMHKIQKRAVVIDDNIVIRSMMYLAFSYDHRIIDGREAVTFLVRIKELIENPQRLLLDL